MLINKFVNEKWRLANFTQPELAEKAGVELRYFLELEQQKVTLNLAQVNQLWQLFDNEVSTVP